MRVGIVDMHNSSIELPIKDRVTPGIEGGAIQSEELPMEDYFLHPSPKVLIPALRIVEILLPVMLLRLRFLASQGFIKPLCDILTCPDPMTVSLYLEGLDNILKVGEADKEMGLKGVIKVYAQMVDECENVRPFFLFCIEIVAQR
ncbi:hypothetical protein PIB30_072634 [Stylosanthes scabra]|uniref:Uncharacterized protein n=1 Tax=Stylosanthes scabra TaxID=79078 RepID=A0ABU6SQP7_9FABA|nr:hypothetical protein [Stylosanthes scabra]